MIDKEEILNNKNFYKPYKNGNDLGSFFKEMHKRAVENTKNEKQGNHEGCPYGNYNRAQ